MLNYQESITNWKFIKELGSGAFGEVSLWSNVETGQSVAIKRCSVDIEKLALDEQSKLKTRWLQEYAWIKEIKTKNIVCACPHLCPDLEEEQNSKVKLPVIVMEYCDGGNLRSKLHKIENVNGFSENDVREILSGLKNAIQYLHTQYKITHRDIKPDNIVIKYGEDGNPIYKLTDMGYARELDKNTIIGSMVGSRNYFAPEIVETAEYKNSVDYWSMGIVAFEIICGAYPFLQDESMFQVLTSIKQKPPGCIAITKTNDGKLCHHMELFTENRLSSAFKKTIESWLQIALESNGRKRGYEAPDELHKQQLQLTFYTKLERALASKILTVFWINRSKYLSYDIDNTTTMTKLCSFIENDTGIKINKFYFVTPAGHTLSQLTPEVQPNQLYDEKFASEDKPMLYLIDFETDGLCNPEDPFLSNTLRLTFEKGDPLQSRILKQCFMSALFLHQNESRRINEFINSINEYAMHLEYEMMKQEQFVNRFHENIIRYEGQVLQYETMIKMGKRLMEEKQMNDVASADSALETITQNLNSLKSEYFKIQRQFQNILNKIRDFMKKSPLKTYQETVLSHVKQFEDIFDDVREKLRTICSDEIRKHVFELLRIRNDFYANTKKWLQKKENGHKMDSPDSIIEICLEFRSLIDIVFENQRLCEEYRSQMIGKTQEYMDGFGKLFYTQGKSIECSFRSLTEDMDTLDIDNEKVAGSLEEDKEETLLDFPTNSLIMETKNLTQKLNLILGSENY